jgi:hypothetical protein
VKEEGEDVTPRVDRATATAKKRKKRPSSEERGGKLHE